MSMNVWGGLTRAMGEPDGTVPDVQNRRDGVGFVNQYPLLNDPTANAKMEYGPPPSLLPWYKRPNNGDC